MLGIVEYLAIVCKNGLLIHSLRMMQSTVEWKDKMTTSRRLNIAGFHAYLLTTMKEVCGINITPVVGGVDLPRFVQFEALVIASDLSMDVC